MTTELSILGWALVLAVVHIMAAATARNRETGLKFNAGPRDGPAPPPGIVTARLQRAEKNFFETFPLFAVAVLIAHVGGREGALTLWGAWLYLVCRIAYLPLYGFGVPVVRSIVWVASLLGVFMILFAILKP